MSYSFLCHVVVDFGVQNNQILIDNIKQFAPIVYTPTVGLVCQNYSGLFRRPRGMYFSAADKGEMISMVYNWPADEVHCFSYCDAPRVTEICHCFLFFNERCRIS